MRRTAASVGFLGDCNVDQPAVIPALDRVSGEDVRVAPSKCYRGMVSDKDGPRARFLHVALTIKLSRQIYARLGELGKTMLTLHREWFSGPRRTKVGKGCRSQRRTIGQRPVQHSGAHQSLWKPSCSQSRVPLYCGYAFCSKRRGLWPGLPAALEGSWLHPESRLHEPLLERGR